MCLIFAEYSVVRYRFVLFSYSCFNSGLIWIRTVLLVDLCMLFAVSFQKVLQCHLMAAENEFFMPKGFYCEMKDVFPLCSAWDCFIWIILLNSTRTSTSSVHMIIRGCTEVSFKEWRWWMKSWGTSHVQLVRNQSYCHCLSRENRLSHFQGLLWPLSSTYLNVFIWPFSLNSMNVLNWIWLEGWDSRGMNEPSSLHVWTC